MGWNSWEAFRREVSEDGIKAQADLMVSTGLLDAGYNYLVIDGGWKPGSRAPNGDLIADPQKFPHGAAIVRSCSASVPSRSWLWAEPIAHLYRCEHDVIDRWSGAGGAIMSILDLHIDLLDTGSVGFWPDPDMLEAGRKGRSDQPNIQTPKMTDAEYRAQFSLWSIMNAPLFISLDLRSLDDAVKKILLNKDVIGVNQDPLGSPCRCVRALGEQQMFVKQLSDGYAIVLLNRGATAAKIQTTCAALGIPRNEWNARDLWTGEKTQITNGVIDTGVETHGVVMLRLSSK